MYATPFKRNDIGFLGDPCCFTCRFSVDGTRIKVKLLPELWPKTIPSLFSLKVVFLQGLPLAGFSPLAAGHHLSTVL